MSKRSNYTIDDLKLFIAQTINGESDNHSKLISSIPTDVSNTAAGAETIKILNAIHNAKIEILHRIFSEAQKIQ